MSQEYFKAHLMPHMTLISFLNCFFFNQTLDVRLICSLNFTFTVIVL